MDLIDGTGFWTCGDDPTAPVSLSNQFQFYGRDTRPYRIMGLILALYYAMKGGM